MPPRRRSRFILEAIEERLAIEEQSAALQEAAGAWSDENHPELGSDVAIDRWPTAQATWFASARNAGKR